MKKALQCRAFFIWEVGLAGDWAGDLGVYGRGGRWSPTATRHLPGVGPAIPIWWDGGP